MINNLEIVSVIFDEQGEDVVELYPCLVVHDRDSGNNSFIRRH